MLQPMEYWIGQYKQKKAYWIHDGNPKRPHAILTSGEHSEGFFNSRLVIPDEILMRSAAVDLLGLFDKAGGYIGDVECVVGPQTGAAKLAEYLSDQVSVFERRGCPFVSPAKLGEGGEKRFVLSDSEASLLGDRQVLFCEDALTTGESVAKVIKLIEDAHKASGAGAKILPFILVLVNRSGLDEVSGKKIVSLIDRPMPKWPADECPFCKAGSEAIRAKDNWDRLNSEY